MKEQTQKLLDDLVNQIADKDELAQVQDEFFKRGVEALVKSELTVHLSHSPYVDNPEHVDPLGKY